MSRAFTIKSDAVAKPLSFSETAKKYGLAASEVATVREAVLAELHTVRSGSSERAAKGIKGRTTLKVIHRKKAARRK